MKVYWTTYHRRSARHRAEGEKESTALLRKWQESQSPEDHEAFEESIRKRRRDPGPEVGVSGWKIIAWSVVGLAVATYLVVALSFGDDNGPSREQQERNEFCQAVPEECVPPDRDGGIP